MKQVAMWSMGGSVRRWKCLWLEVSVVSSVRGRKRPWEVASVRGWKCPRGVVTVGGSVCGWKSLWVEVSRVEVSVVDCAGWKCVG